MKGVNKLQKTTIEMIANKKFHENKRNNNHRHVIPSGNKLYPTENIPIYEQILQIKDETKNQMDLLDFQKTSYDTQLQI